MCPGERNTNDVMPMIRAKRVGAACPHAVSTVHADPPSGPNITLPMNIYDGRDSTTTSPSWKETP